jgi:exonuclease III
MVNTIKIVSINVRGLRKDLKRQKYFHWFRNHNKFKIIFIQESHSTKEDEQLWSSEWGGSMIFSHGKNNSKGVSILFEKDVGQEIHSSLIDLNGRYIILDVTIEGRRITLANIYGPNEDDPNFFLEIIKLIEDIPNDNRIIGGDFNCILDTDKDKKGGCEDHANKAVRAVLLTYMEETELIDIWRSQHEEERIFTHHISKPEFIFTRLDFFMVSFGLASLVEKSSIKSKFQSDHSPVSITILFDSNKRGKGFWKLNCSLLQDPDYVTLIKNTITETMDINKASNSMLLWDTIKLQVRGQSIKYGSQKKRSRDNILKALQRRLDSLEIRYNKNPNEEVKINITLVNEDINNIVEEKTRGAIIRSKITWYEEGEKPTKYFLNLEKRNFNRKVMNRLQLSNGTIIKDKDSIMQEQANYYKTLYTLQDDVMDPDEKNNIENIFL